MERKFSGKLPLTNRIPSHEIEYPVEKPTSNQQLGQSAFVVLCCFSRKTTIAGRHVQYSRTFRRNLAFRDQVNQFSPRSTLIRPSLICVCVFVSQPDGRSVSSVGWENLCVCFFSAQFSCIFHGYCFRVSEVGEESYLSWQRCKPRPIGWRSRDFFCDGKLEERKIAVENSASARASPGKVLFRQTRTSALNFGRKTAEESLGGTEVARGV